VLPLERWRLPNVCYGSVDQSQSKQRKTICDGTSPKTCVLLGSRNHAEVSGHDLTR